MVAEPEIFALVFAADELSPEIVSVAVSPEVVSVSVEPEVFAVVSVAAVAEPGVVFVSEPQASVDIAVAFVVLVPVSFVVVEVDSSGRPKFLAFPSVDHFSSSSSSVEVVG